MRDYLNANEEKAKEYSELKKQLANKYPNDRIAYTNGKSKLIEEILNSASMWRKCNDYVNREVESFYAMHSRDEILT